MLRDPEIKPLVAFVEMGYLGSWGSGTRAGSAALVFPPGQSSPSVACAGRSRPYVLAASVGSDRATFAKYVIDTYRNGGTGMLRGRWSCGGPNTTGT